MKCIVISQEWPSRAFPKLSQELCHPLCYVAEESHCPLTLICSSPIGSSPHPEFPEPTSLPRHTSFHYFPQVFPRLVPSIPTFSQSWLPGSTFSPPSPEHHCFQLWLQIGFPGFGPLSPSLTDVCQLRTHSSSALSLLTAELGKHRQPRLRRG